MRTRRAAVCLLALLVLAPGLPGCAQLARDSDLDRRNAAEAQRLTDALGRAPGIRSAQVTHVLDASTPGVVQVTLVVEPGRSTADVTQDVVAAVWRSGLEPVAGVRITANDPDGTPRSGIEPVVLASAAPELEQRYGPRPVRGR